ncbi:copper resistance protein [Escherichia coli]|nr:copper resistance protein [Escherichia coli]MDI4448866.1 copper resistance protein [Escherichia coli]
MSIKNDGHYFCRAGGNRPDGLNEPVTKYHSGGAIMWL